MNTSANVPALSQSGGLGRKPSARSPTVARRLGDDCAIGALKGQPLTLREREVLTWAAVGKTAPETAGILGVSARTATKNLNSGAAKLGCHNKIQAVTAALRAGMLIDIESRLRLNPNEVKSLSKVEIDHLLWGAEGKTAWETGVILETTERNATFHLKAATKKLGCNNKIHAVTAAIRMGII